MPGDSNDRGSGLIGLAGEGPESADAHVCARGQVALADHAHDWPSSTVSRRDLAACELCGLTMLKLLVNSSAWVVRRVEHVAFIDECTVRRRVSIDYFAPQDAVILRRPDGQQVRVLPLAIMRRKSLVKFDFRDHDGHAVPLLGLRQNQALTLAIARGWAAASLQALGAGVICAETGHFLDDVIAGDQTEMWRAFNLMWAATDGSQLQRLGKDKQFRALLDRLADGFLLYGFHEGPPGERRLIKFSYDEPLTLRYSKSSYLPHDGDGRGGKERYEGTDLSRWHWRVLCSAIGFSPTRIKFPVPAAELAGSFHFEISVPPEVSVINAALLAGRPKPEEEYTATAPVTSTVSQGEQPVVMKGRERRRPSFDSISGRYPTIDLHVADVPFGSRSRAQVVLQARPAGWFGTAVFSSWLASAILGFAYLAKPEFGVGSTLLMSFVAGLAVLLVRQDPHPLLTRLLSKVRLLATFAAVLALAAAVVMASRNPASAYPWLLGLFLASLVPTALVTVSWFLALMRSVKGKAKESPWEHHRPRKSKAKSQDPDLAAQRQDEERHETLARRMEEETYPYDWAHRKLGFSRPAIRVASIEGERQTYPWNKAYSGIFNDRLRAYLETLAERDSSLGPLWAEDENDLTRIGNGGWRRLRDHQLWHA